MPEILLAAEEFEVIDLLDLVKSYLSNCRISHPGRQFEYRGTQNPVKSNVSDYRIEQLLDKLIDNAVDFHESSIKSSSSLSRLVSRINSSY